MREGQREGTVEYLSEYVTSHTRAVPFQDLMRRTSVDSRAFLGSHAFMDTGIFRVEGKECGKVDKVEAKRAEFRLVMMLRS